MLRNIREASKRVFFHIFSVVLYYVLLYNPNFSTVSCLVRDEPNNSDSHVLTTYSFFSLWFSFHRPITLANRMPITRIGRRCPASEKFNLEQQLYSIPYVHENKARVCSLFFSIYHNYIYTTIRRVCLVIYFRHHAEAQVGQGGSSI